MGADHVSRLKALGLCLLDVALGASNARVPHTYLAGSRGLKSATVSCATGAARAASDGNMTRRDEEKLTTVSLRDSSSFGAICKTHIRFSLDRRKPPGAAWAWRWPNGMPLVSAHAGPRLAGPDMKGDVMRLPRRFAILLCLALPVVIVPARSTTGASSPAQLPQLVSVALAQLTVLGYQRPDVDSDWGLASASYYPGSDVAYLNIDG